MKPRLVIPALAVALLPLLAACQTEETGSAAPATVTVTSPVPAPSSPLQTPPP